MDPSARPGNPPLEFTTFSAGPRGGRKGCMELTPSLATANLELGARPTEPFWSSLLAGSASLAASTVFVEFNLPVADCNFILHS
jgi:hypothetical protein